MDTLDLDFATHEGESYESGTGHDAPGSQATAPQPPVQTALRKAPQKAPIEGKRTNSENLSRLWTSIYCENFDFVKQCAKRWLPAGSSEIDDAAQEVFLVLHKNLASLDHSRSIRPWLYATTFRVASGLRRKKKREVVGSVANETQSFEEEFQSFVEEEVESRPDTVASVCEDRALINAALEKLAEKERAILVMYDIEGFTVVEIADALNLNKNTVYGMLRRARGQMLRSMQATARPLANKARARWLAVLPLGLGALADDAAFDTAYGKLLAFMHNTITHKSSAGLGALAKAGSAGAAATALGATGLGSAGGAASTAAVSTAAGTSSLSAGSLLAGSLSSLATLSNAAILSVGMVLGGGAVLGTQALTAEEPALPQFAAISPASATPTQNSLVNSAVDDSDAETETIAEPSDPEVKEVVRWRNRPAKAQKAKAVTSPENDDTDSRRAELRLIKQAQRALQIRNFELVWNSLRQHQRDHWHGTMVEERELLWIEALVAQGKPKLAKVRADRFVKNYPSASNKQRAAKLLAAR